MTHRETMPTPPQRMKKRLAIGLASLALSLGVAELAVRGLDIAPEFYPVQAGRFRLSKNPRIGYELVPDFDADGSGRMLDFRGKANSLGFRDRERTPEKPDGTFRVIVLGDSIVQGLGIEHDEQVLTAIMEDELRESTQAVEVINFGVSGYATGQEVATLAEKGLALEPDLVLVCVCVNDTYLDCGGILTALQRSAAGKRPIASPPAWLRGSALVRLGYGVWRGYTAASTEPIARDLGRDTVSEALDELAQLSQAEGFEVCIVWFPRLAPPASPNDALLFQRVRATAQKHSFDVYDLTPDFETCLDSGPIAIDTIHPNVAGHRGAGLALARHIDRTWLAPR